MKGVNVTSRGFVESCLGHVEQVKIFADGYGRMSWEEVWRAFAEAYPNRWAVQVFPPEAALVNGKNVYHLFVLAVEPRGLNLKQ
jgi:hypothetical protein